MFPAPCTFLGRILNRILLSQLLTIKFPIWEMQLEVLVRVFAFVSLPLPDPYAYWSFAIAVSPHFLGLVRMLQVFIAAFANKQANNPFDLFTHCTH